MEQVAERAKSWQNQSRRIHDGPPRLQSVFQQLLVGNIPHDYEDRDEWGKTKKVWDGVHIRLDGLQVRTKRKWKQVNQGTWKMHKISLVDPEEHLQIELRNLRRIQPGTWSFDLMLAARLNAYGRVSEWQRGIRLFSVSGDARVDVRLVMQCELKASLEPVGFPPDVVIEPRVTTAKLEMNDFRLRRISHADGPLVKQLGKSIRGVVEDELAKKDKKLVTKINRAIAKHQDELRLSLQDALWGEI